METRWARRLGPGIAALAAVVAIASTTAGAPPPIWDPPDCPGLPSVGPRTSAAWFRLDPDLSAGALVGQRLTIGNAERATQWRMDLDAESFAAQPRGGTVLIGTDDGRASRLSLINVTDACRWTVATSRDVVRSALSTPDGSAVVEHRVDRRTRADLGIWRRSLDGSAPTRLLPAIPTDDRFGPTWVTELGWSDHGDSLVEIVEGSVEFAAQSRDGGEFVEGRADSPAIAGGAETFHGGTEFGLGGERIAVHQQAQAGAETSEGLRPSVRSELRFAVEKPARQREQQYHERSAQRTVDRAQSGCRVFDLGYRPGAGTGGHRDA